MTRKGFPQIFSGCTFHFNGIIPRTLRHPSHSIEWRMAEAHGATCLAEQLPDVVTHLLYRPGYERSEKVRAAFRSRICCVPINWMLDSLLQSRMLHESLYRLEGIPTEALPTSSSTILPHHQHAYFMQHHETFALQGAGARQVGSAAKQLQAALVNKAHAQLKIDAPPPLDPIPALVPRVTAAVWQTKPSPGARSMFRGLRFCFAGDEIAEEASAAVAAHGGVVVSDPSNSTHVVFTSDTKKSSIMLSAVQHLDVCGEDDAPFVFVASNWLLDCMYIESLVPPYGPYTATSKLLATLRKRASRAADGS